MAKTIGLSRNLKLPWLNYIAKLLSENLTEVEIKESLNEYLKYEISSPTNLRKTREILMAIWYYDNNYTKKFRTTALALIENFSDYALEIHWCMIMSVYPIFADVCRLIGKMADFQEDITLGRLKQKIFDEWGERTTLYHSIDKLISTMKAFDVIACDKPGKYYVKKHPVSEYEVVSFMIYTLMNLSDSAYHSLIGINSSVYLFPFEYQVSKEMLLQDKRFEICNFGGELSIGLREKV